MYVLELREITTVYPADNFVANRNVSLALRKGEILCLAGENGAGKTSLMKTLCGFLQPALGEILVRGVPVSIDSPLAAARLGIGMVHQHSMLFPDFTVAENVVMGMEPKKWGFVYDFKTAVEQVSAIIETHAFSIRAGGLVRDLSVGQMQQVEIVKLLYRNADILILDEPTATLTEQECTSLFQTLRLLAAGGKSLILITHKLSEIKRISNRVAVMRKGELVALRDNTAIDEYEISRLMLGRDITQSATKPDAGEKRVKATAKGAKGAKEEEEEEEKNPEVTAHSSPFASSAPFAVNSSFLKERGQHTTKENIIAFEEVSVKRRKQERPLLNKLSFTARSGETLAFAGAGNSGLEELEAVLGGLLPISSGLIRHRGQDISRLDAEALRKRNLAYVPADRMSVGSASHALIGENTMIGRRHDFSRWGILNRAGVSRFCHALFERYGIRGNERLHIGSLSGGNIQKLILAREIDLLEQGGDYIVFSKPTWGLDVAASNAVYERIIQLRDQGAAILLLSSNLDEIIAVADRVLVLYRGSIAAELKDFQRIVSGERRGQVTAKNAESAKEEEERKKANPEVKAHPSSFAVNPSSSEDEDVSDPRELIGAYMLGLRQAAHV